MKSFLIVSWRIAQVAQIEDHPTGKFKMGVQYTFKQRFFSELFLRYFRFQNLVLYLERMLPYEARQYNLWSLENGFG